MLRSIGTIGRIGAWLPALLVGSYVAAGQDALRIEVSPNRAGKYGKVEIVIHTDRSYQNPYDPDEVDVSVLLNTPGHGRLSVPAFYYQPYQRRRVGTDRHQSDWLYPGGSPVWMARFAPTQLGTYQAVVRLRDRTGTLQSPAVSFECTPSESKGFIRTSQSDPRFLEFSEGGPFFPIGHNLAFIGSAQYFDLSEAEAVFARMSSQGVNFLRIWTCCKDWALAIEARKSAWGRSWHWDPPIVPMPDGPADRKCVKLAPGDRARLDVSPSHAVALRPDTDYVLTARVRTEAEAGLAVSVRGQKVGAAPPGKADGRWTSFRHEFRTGPDDHWLGRMTLELEGTGTAWVTDLSLQEAGGGPELLWEADVNRPVPGRYNPVDCFMLDQIVESAREHGIYLQLCLITRDLYMKSLDNEASREYDEAIRYARKLLRYAVARWGYSTSVAAWEYFNEINPGLPTDRFYRELGEHLEEIDVYGHLRTTSTWAPSAKDCRHPKLDVAQVHFYLRPSERNRLDEVAAVLDRTRFLRQHAPDKPVLVGEFGLATEKWGLSPEMKEDRNLVHFHNSLWASALSGASGTVLFWWWDQLDRMDAYGHYRPLAQFLADVPFTTADLQPAVANVADRDVRVIGLAGPRSACLWLLNPQATWPNAVVKKITPSEIRGATLRVEGLQPGTYQVQWWDTREGRAIAEDRAVASQNSLDASIPPFARDVACKITLAR